MTPFHWKTCLNGAMGGEIRGTNHYNYKSL